MSWRYTLYALKICCPSVVRRLQAGTWDGSRGWGSLPGLGTGHRPGPGLRSRLGSRLFRGLGLGIGLTLGLAVGLVFGTPVEAQSLKPSRSSLHRQGAQARMHDYTFLRNRSQVRRFVDQGWLVPVPEGRNYRLHRVSFPYARPEVRLFIQRLSRQYRAACGERLVVTSLTRPKSHQPWNASPLSVHPTGMALDLRRSKNRRCRAWLEKTLLYLEGRKVLEASRERFPAHYHVALFPRSYREYVSLITSARNIPYRVRSGDSLWGISRRYDTSPDRIRRHNDLRSNTIYPGQRLLIP